MTFDELLFHNYGVYLGRQVVQLTPPSPRRPVILVGGLNGAGKTTFLDALHLVLYGKRARLSTRGRKPYERFLRECIHHDAAEQEAGLELEFRQRSSGREHRYRICRHWRARGPRDARERVQIFVDGQLDKMLTASWDEMVETFIPLGISELFLFNGEKIEGLAEPSSAAKLLETGIHALLGLDLVDRLTADLRILERRKHKLLKSDEERAEIEQGEDEVNELVRRVEGLQHELNDHTLGVQHLEAQLAELDTRCRAEGGELFAERATLERQHAGLETELAAAEHALRMHSHGASPLLLVKELMRDVLAQARLERDALEASALVELLENRDDALLAYAERLGVTRGALADLDDHLMNDRQKHARATALDRYLNLSTRGFEQLSGLMEMGLEDAREAGVVLLNEAHGLRERVLAQEQQLGAVPDGDAVVHLIEERERVRARLELAQKERDKVVDDLTFFQSELEERRADLVRMIERQVYQDFEREDSSRLLHHAKRVRGTLSRFRMAMLEHHLEHIQSLVLESFQELMRKSTLVDRIVIDPENFIPSLHSGPEQVIDSERLSAGERQLLAVSLLWGLARASGRLLPAVIDTPLGRLDSEHRMHLVTRYFPHASHQVLLLSTDEEIDARYYPELKPWVGREYHLSYDSSVRATRIEKGYPFGTEHAA